MQIEKGNILLLDFALKENKDNFEEELKKITNADQIPKYSTFDFDGIIHGKTQIWTFKEIPSDLDYFDLITIHVYDFDKLKSSLMIMITGRLTDNALFQIEHPPDNDVPFINKFREKFVSFWNQEKLGVFTNRTIGYSFGHGLIEFLFSVDDISEVFDSTKITATKDLEKEISKNIELGLYGIGGNACSLIESITNKVSIIGQLHSMGLGNNRHPWQTKIEFVTDIDNTTSDFLKGDVLGKIVFPSDTIALLFIQAWGDYRISQLDKWEDEIYDLTLHIQDLKSNIASKEFHKIDLESHLIKTEFLTNFARFPTEYLFIEEFMEYQKKINFGHWIPEIEIPNPRFENSKKYFENLGTTIQDQYSKLKSHYDILNEQYLILSKHISDSISLINSDSMLKITKRSARVHDALLALALTTLLVLIASFTLFKSSNI